jgi:hypothetical protein
VTLFPPSKRFNGASRSLVSLDRGVRDYLLRALRPR